MYFAIVCAQVTSTFRSIAFCNPSRTVFSPPFQLSWMNQCHGAPTLDEGAVRVAASRAGRGSRRLEVYVRREIHREGVD